MKKTMILSLCSILVWMMFSSYQVYAEEYPITLNVTVQNDGSIQLKADGDTSDTLRSSICIFRKGDIIDLSKRHDKQIAPIVSYDLLTVMLDDNGSFYPSEGYTRKVYQNIEPWVRIRTETLTDGFNSPLKPGEYFAIAIYRGEEDPDQFLSEPVPFVVNTDEWDRSLHVERQENGSFAFETKGFFSGYSDVRIYRQGAECNPKTKDGVVLSWAIDFQATSRETYPEGCGTMKNTYCDHSALQGGIGTRPLKSGNYYAIVVDENKGEILSDAVPFEVPAEPTPSAAPQAPIRTPAAQATIQPTTETEEGHTLLYIGIAAAVIIVIAVIILSAKHGNKNK